MKDKTKKHNVGGVGMKDKTKKHYIDWGSVWTVVITGCILGALGVLGTMVYQGAILKTQTNEATALIIIDSVAANTVAIHNLTALIEAGHHNYESFVPIPEPEVAEPAEKPTKLKRFVDAMSFKPLWEKSEEVDTVSYGTDQASDPDDELDDFLAEVDIALEVPELAQQSVVDDINLKIAEKANTTK